jgi:SAM-dependent methyltransferase
VAGLDTNPGMLAVARELPSGPATVEWYEENAEAMPLPDDSFDAVFCQMGLQFMDNKAVALKEMRRVLIPGGRLILNLPGPAARIFALLEESLDEHLSSDAAGFLNQVFSLHEKVKIQNLFAEAGFAKTDIQSVVKELTLPPAHEFLWQYIYATPLAALVAGAGDESCLILEKDLVNKWQNFRENGGIKDGQPMVTVIARK